MSIKSNLKGRLRNTPLPYNRALMPLFETVVNSIHAIEEVGLSSLDEGKITIEIIRDNRMPYESEDEKKKPGREFINEIVGFRVIDNGIGFNKANYESFETLDTEYKITKGCRGVGRLLWLKAFDTIQITSSYFEEGDTLITRTFSFTAEGGVSPNKPTGATTGGKRETSVHLDGFKREYREASCKSTAVIANTLLEHCLWYFVRQGGAPNIILKDDSSEIDLHHILDEHMLSSTDTESLTLKNYVFELTHVKFRSHTSPSHVLALCASNRLVDEVNITGKIPGLHGRLKDIKGEFVYACYVSSNFLDQRVRPERMSFDIPEEKEDLLSITELSLSEIKDAILGQVKNYLAEYLVEKMKEGRQRVDNFVAQKAPRYRPILKRIDENNLSVDPAMSDKELELFLHKHLLTPV